MTKERLQKILSSAGYGSRRQCESLISGGRVSVNGKIAILGSKADADTDIIRIDGKLIKIPEKKIYIMLNKPRGILSTTSSNDGRPSVLDLVNVNEHVYPVGRLDIDSEGLIILTNDGKVANLLTHPRYGHEKEYRVLVAGIPDYEQLSAMRRGIVLSDGYRSRRARVVIERKANKGTWLRITLREGRKRQIREMGSMVGLPVIKIVRVRIGKLKLGNLKPGKWRFMTEQEINSLELK